MEQVSSACNSGVGVSIFNRDRNGKVKIMVSKLPTKFRISFSEILARVTHHTPNGSGATAPQGRGSLPGILSNVLNGGLANTPLYTMVRGAGAGDNSCNGLLSYPHPNRDSCATFMGCGTSGSVHNNNRFSNELATPVIFTNTIYHRVLRSGNVGVTTRVDDVNSISSGPFYPARVSSALVRGLGDSSFTLVSRGTRGPVESTIRSTEVTRSDVNKAVRYYMANVSTNCNRPVFRNIRNIVTGTIFNIPTVGNVRFNGNFRLSAVENSRSGSSFRCGSNGIIAAAGGYNNVLNKVAGKVPVVFHTTMGPAPSVSRPREAMGLRAGRGTRLIVRNERSPYVIPETIPIVRTIATITVVGLV